METKHVNVVSTDPDRQGKGNQNKTIEVNIVLTFIHKGCQTNSPFS
jgi:hypothetical protein